MTLRKRIHPSHPLCSILLHRYHRLHWLQKKHWYLHKTRLFRHLSARVHPLLSSPSVWMLECGMSYADLKYFAAGKIFLLVFSTFIPNLFRCYKRFESSYPCTLVYSMLSAILELKFRCRQVYLVWNKSSKWYWWKFFFPYMGIYHQIIIWEQIKIIWRITSKYVPFFTLGKNQTLLTICALPIFSICLEFCWAIFFSTNLNKSWMCSSKDHKPKEDQI